ncbi:Archaeal GTP cyclohydrolase III [Halapricum desulfuricans]|uniref:GTP cyclohydrolase III n=1 Tax=Halapricum desulfuricans TaxID=2841257 RepID=A0A897NJZ2_9EURY|nr:GTP cyclohydrolase IIa [Halapricum desulfuricans]QSG13052.1 Archaeal GTP cyclohydrolase III [Halapricum desulfuricans]
MEAVTTVMQVALIQIDDYGPWTVTPEPRRETDLQSLQASLFADFAEFVGAYDGYAFYGRFDNMYAVVNEIDPTAFERFQRRVRNSYPVTVSVGVGRASTPVEALDVASERLQAAGSAQDGDRREVLAVGSDEPVETGSVTVGHFDVVDVTGSLTDQRNAVDVTLAIRRATLELVTYLRHEYDSIAHFVGGDNIIAVCPDIGPGAFDDAIEHVSAETGIELQVGVGRGPTAHAAGDEAKAALERCRATGARIRGVDKLPADD